MLSLYNSLSQQKEVFEPILDKKVTLYVCGITPYDTTHLGHAFTYLSFDVLVRYLTYLGNQVIYTQNVTDINDRDNDILKRAQEQRVTWQDLASFWTKKFLEDMKTLNWVLPTNYLNASEQIPAMVHIIQDILKNGFGYENSGNVFLDITKDPEFGKLSRLNEAQMLQRAKEFEEDIENPLKKHPLDITLWRAASNAADASHIPSFDSPWGKGRPGWHIECSAMAINSLAKEQTVSGESYRTIDIHGGGNDLIYPHHESEIAQSEAGTGKKPFAKFWMHTGTVGINGQKMSKSLGNLILISDLLKSYSANAIRWVLLSHHYREAWEYNEKEFQHAEETISVITETLSRHSRLDPESQNNKDRMLNQVQHDALDALNNDLDTPSVLKLIEQYNSEADPQILFEIKEVLHMLGFIL